MLQKQMRSGLLNRTDPKIQEQITIFVANGLQIIHDPKITDDILNTIKAGKDPLEAIASVTVKIVDLLERHAEQKGVKLADATKIYGANNIMGEIILLAEKAGIIPKLTDEQKRQAYSLAVSMYLNDAVQSGKMTKEQLIQLAQQAKQTQQGQKIAGRVENEVRMQGAEAPPGVQGPQPGVPQQPMPPNQR